VPEVGEEGTPWEVVDAFYDFWFGFRSWREFPHPDEEDVEQAECREEKRCAAVHTECHILCMLASVFKSRGLVTCLPEIVQQAQHVICLLLPSLNVLLTACPHCPGCPSGPALVWAASVA
jgi:hypothetical protein